MVDVEIVYIPEKSKPVRILLTLPAGATVNEAIVLSKLREQYPETVEMPMGIFSKSVVGSTVVRNGDRIEIYQPLKMDPKDKRRERALKNKS